MYHHHYQSANHDNTRRKPSSVAAGTFGSSGRFGGNMSKNAPSTSIHSPTPRRSRKSNSPPNINNRGKNFFDPTQTPPPSSGPTVLSPLEGNDQQQQQQQQQQKPYELDDLLSLSPETPPLMKQQQQQQSRPSSAKKDGKPPSYQQTGGGGINSSQSLNNQSIPLYNASSTSTNAPTQQPQQQNLPSTFSRPMSAASQTSSTRIANPSGTSTNSNSGRDHRQHNNSNEGGDGVSSLMLSSQNLAKATGLPAPGIPGTSSRSKFATSKGTSKQAAVHALQSLRSRARQRNVFMMSSSGQFGGVGSGGGGGAAGFIMNEENTIEDEEKSWPLLRALHVAKDQLHLPSRVVEWMREALTWNLSSNATEANDEILHIVETVRGMTLELFKMVDEIEALYDKAMTSWRSIPMGGDSTMTAKSHASFVDAHGRLKQVVQVFQRLVQHWQVGHTKLFDAVRPASVSSQLPSAFIFTCGASDGDDYTYVLSDKLAMLQSTAESFSSMIFDGGVSSSTAGGQQKDDAMKPPSLVQKSSALVSFSGDDNNNRDHTTANLDTTNNQNNDITSTSSMFDISTNNNQQQQSAEDFSIVRRPMSAAKKRRLGLMNNDTSLLSSNNPNDTSTSTSFLKSPLVPPAAAAALRGNNNSVSPAYISAAHTKNTNNVPAAAATTGGMIMPAPSSSRAAFEARKIRSITVIQRWWKKIFARLQRGIAKKGDDLLFDEAMQMMMSNSHQHRWTKRDTMLLHDIARRLHFLRCIRRIERFIIFLWIPKHFAVLKMQRALRAYFWRKRDRLYRKYRGAAIKIQRWYWQCLRRRERRHMLRVQREQAIKARTLRAAASAPSVIRPPPPPEVNENALTQDDCVLRTDGELDNFATLEKGNNMCVAWFERNGGVEGNKWSDEEDDEEKEKNKMKKDDGDGDNTDDDGSDDEGDIVDEFGRRRRRRARGGDGGRPRSAAERLLIRPGRETSSFTQRMLRFAQASKQK